MGAGEQLLLLEQLQVAPDCGGGHTQLGGQLSDAYASGAGEPFEHGGEAVSLAHWPSLPLFALIGVVF